MPCIHGLDQYNCPICRISNSTLPINPIHKKDFNKESSSSFAELFKNKLSGEKDFKEEMSPLKSNMQPNLINHLPKPNLINSIPNFDNMLFNERINKLKLENQDNLKISKKISVENTELNLEDK
jgi:hypothetical protein